jgi:RNA polymerase sigma-70 factor (ECF subfamily)
LRQIHDFDSVARGARPIVALSSLADAELVEAIRAGSEPCFNELYQRYFQRVYNFTFLRVRHHADAEEIVQETFTAVFKSIEAFRGQSSLLSWIYGIAKNTVNNHVRRSRTRAVWMERAESELLRPSSGFAACTPEEHLNLRRYADAINERLGAAAGWQAEVFLLRHVENLSIQEISRRTARSSDAIRSSLYRMKRLFLEASQVGLLTVGP